MRWCRPSWLSSSRRSSRSSIHDPLSSDVARKLRPGSDDFGGARPADALPRFRWAGGAPARLLALPARWAFLYKTAYAFGEVRGRERLAAQRLELGLQRRVERRDERPQHALVAP